VTGIFAGIAVLRLVVREMAPATSKRGTPE
jgi:hypothetical protein